MLTKKDEFTKIHIQLDNLVEDYKYYEEELEKLEAILIAKIEQAQSIYDDKKDAIEKEMKLLKIQIKTLSEQVPQTHAKTQRKVRLLNGDVVIKNATQSPQPKDKEALIKWAIDNGLTEYYSTEEIKKLNWKGLKPSLEIIDGQVIHKETGLIMDHVVIEVKDEEVVIK